MIRFLLIFVVLLAPSLAAEESQRASVRWLAEWAEGALANLSESRTPNEAAKERATMCLLAFLLELHPDAGSPELRDAVLQRTLRFARGERAMGEDALENWSQAFCALALIERAQRGEADGDALAALVARIQSGQRSDGGWGHGFRGSIDSYPSTLIAATNGSLLALGLCERLGLKVDEKCIERGLNLYKSVRAETGAFPYGGPLHRVDFEAGRTAGALTAMTALGRTDDEILRCTADYLFVNVLSIPEGHGSPAYHIFEGALAFHALGADAWKRYEETVLSGVRDVVRGDGSFDDLYDRSPDSHLAMGSAELNRAFRTALYTAALSVPLSHTAASLREYGEDRLPVIVSRHEPNTCCLVWRRNLRSATSLFSFDAIVAVVEESGRIGFRSAGSGELLSELEHEIDCEVPLEVVDVQHVGDRVLVQLRESLAEDFDADRLAARVFRTDAPVRAGRKFLVCYSLSELSLRWNREFELEPRAVRLAEDQVFVLGSGGGLNVLDARTGNLDDCRSSLPSIAQCVIETGPGGCLVVGTDATLKLLDREGEELWVKRVAASADATAASWLTVRFAGEKLWAGSTDGLVRGIDIHTGKTVSEISLRAAVRELLLPPGQEELLLVLTDDGRVSALSRGAVAWEVDLAGGHEWRGLAKSFIEDDRLWIAHEGHGSVRGIDLKSGEVAVEYALPDDAAWTIADGQLIYAQDGRLFSLK